MKLLLLISLLWSSVAAGNEPLVADDEQQMSPAEMHRYLGAAKASALSERRVASQLATGGRLDGTQINYDMKFYDIAIRIDDTAEVLYGRIGFTAAAAASEVTQIQIDLQADMVADSIVAPSGPLGFYRDGDIVVVQLDRLYTDGELFQFDFYYHGHPNQGGFMGFSFDFNAYGSKVISSLSEPYYARSWWPCKDRMDDKADSFAIAIEVDTAFYVASNGTLDSVIAPGGNSHVYYYTGHHPMASYLFSVAISDYEVWYDEWNYNDGQVIMPIVHAVYPERLSYSLGKYNVTPEALTVLSDLYGVYPFADEKYGHANFEWGGGMEHQTMTSMTSANFGFSEPVVVHEMAHQWWGDMITCESWSDIWLNEGWATYTEALYYLHKSGWTAYHDYMADMCYAGGGTIYVYDTTDVWTIFNTGLSYDKAAWVLHMLRHVIGDSAFFAGIEAYYNSEYQYGSAKTEDFQEIFEQVSGRDLSDFFSEWIYGTYRPDYEFAYLQEASDQGGIDLYLLVLQTQTTSPQVFDMPVDFFFDFQSVPDDTLTFEVNDRREMFKLNFPSYVNNIFLDPSNWIMKYADEVSFKARIVTGDDDLSEGQFQQTYEDTLISKGGTGWYVYTIVSGTLPPGLVLDDEGIITGVPSDTGLYPFRARVVDNGAGYIDEVDFTIHVGPLPPLAGDVDYNNDGPDVSDLVYLVDYMFRHGPRPIDLNRADVNASCQVDIVDLVKFVDFMFREGPPLVYGCAE
ncbi:MAG TPA: M1 family metallopeptidase [candidate division Zixibacteria bacterium]|nr:M1 family metallopeptidase [candidate division Zixibacteria bacterium]